MDQEIKSEWLSRLRSGTVLQGNFHLARPDGRRCCLGVLCDIAAERGIVEVREVEAQTGDGPVDVLEYYDLWGNKSSGVLPGAVVDWAGLPSCDPRTTARPDGAPCGLFDCDDPECGTSTLSRLNDTHGFDFEAIADQIEIDF